MAGWYRNSVDRPSTVTTLLLLLLLLLLHLSEK